MSTVVSIDRFMEDAAIRCILVDCGVFPYLLMFNFAQRGSDRFFTVFVGRGFVSDVCPLSKHIR